MRCISKIMEASDAEYVYLAKVLIQRSLRLCPWKKVHKEWSVQEGFLYPTLSVKNSPTIKNILKGWDAASPRVNFDPSGNCLLAELTIPQLTTLIAKSRSESPTLFGDAISFLTNLQIHRL